MVTENSLRRHVALAKQFCHIRKIADLERLLETPASALTLFAQSPPYDTFTIPKPRGGTRTIENPHDPLKDILRRLNHFLQCVYYVHKPACAYGFILNHKREHAPKNICTNAEQHLHCTNLMNVDMKDFFHSVTLSGVIGIFSNKPFLFPENVSILLAQLCTYLGRLPMGSPTSPVLSNFAALPLDADLMQLSREKDMTYTRFVDDMSFSTVQHFPVKKHFDAIAEIIHAHRFVVNPNKVKWYGNKQEKWVTGLLLSGNRVEIPRAFMQTLQNDLLRLKSLYEVYYGIERSGGGDLVDTLTEHVEGKLQFVRFVYGSRSPEYVQLSKQFIASTQPADDLVVMDWLDIPYAFLTGSNG